MDMNAQRLPVYCGEGQIPNVYEATQDVYVGETCLDDEFIKQSPYHDLSNPKTKRALLDQLAPDYKDVFHEKGIVLAPDEILHTKRPSALKIPLKPREEFDSDTLPDSGLLQAIQYYASTAKITPSSMDETALLALGMLVESWVDEELGSCDPNLFMEPSVPVDMSKFAPPESEQSDEEDGSKSGTNVSDSDSDENLSPFYESDVMSLELSESDTASEVEGGRNIKRRRTEIVVGEGGRARSFAKKFSSSKSRTSDSNKPESLDSSESSDSSETSDSSNSSDGSKSSDGSDSSDSSDGSDGSDSSDSSDGSDSSDSSGSSERSGRSGRSERSGRSGSISSGDRKESRESGKSRKSQNSPSTKNSQDLEEIKKSNSHMNIGASSSESNGESDEDKTGDRDQELLHGYADASDNASSD